MSGDSHRSREDPECEPVAKGRSYNPHIVLLQAPTHPSSSLESQRMYFPIDSPPTPAPSPRPQLPYTGLPLLSQVQPESMSISNQLLTSFTSSHSPQTRRQILTAVLQACTPNELLFLSQTIAPLLKRDFLFSLPPELGLHVLTFIDDPKALIRASLVSKWWYRMVRDESVWRRMCLVHGFGEGDKEGREREWNQHRPANLKDASRSEQPFSAILREDAGHSDGREGLSGLSSPPTDSSSSRPREASKIFSYRRHFKISYIIRLNWRHGGKLLNSQIITPVLPPSRPLIAPSETNPDDAIPSTVTSFALDKSWLGVGLANSSIKVFSTHTGVLARTLVGHESGVWGVCLVGKRGWREGGEGVKERGRGSSNERREMKERKKQKQREQHQEREDRETTPRPSKESASVTLVVDPDSKKPRRRKDTEKGKEKDGEEEERKSRRTTTPSKPSIAGHIRVEAYGRIRDEATRGSSSSSHHEGRPGPSSAATTATPASAGTSKNRRASTSPTTPKRPRKYPSTLPQGLRERVDEFQDSSILHPVEGRLEGETFLILSAGVGTSSAPAATADEAKEADTRIRHDTHHHHHHSHHRRSRRNSTVNHQHHNSQ